MWEWVWGTTQDMGAAGSQLLPQHLQNKPLPSFSTVLVPLQRGASVFPTGRRKHWGKSVVFVYRTGKLWASSAAVWWDVKELQGSDCVSQMQSPCSRQMPVQHLSTSWSCRGHCLPQQWCHLHLVACGHWQGDIPLYLKQSLIIPGSQTR